MAERKIVTRKIVTIGDPILTTPCATVNKFDRKLRSLVKDLFETMYAAHGVGLAAPQIGVGLRVAVIDDRSVGYALINPEITRQEGLQIGEEGCLSIPGLRIEVQRPNFVAVSYIREDGKPATLEAWAFEACVICHELDHLEGKLITDYLDFQL